MHCCSSSLSVAQHVRRLLQDISQITRRSRGSILFTFAIAERHRLAHGMQSELEYQHFNKEYADLCQKTCCSKGGDSSPQMSLLNTLHGYVQACQECLRCLSKS